MKKYEEFINESKIRKSRTLTPKFEKGDYVKCKDGVGKVLLFDIYSNGINRYLKYDIELVGKKMSLKNKDLVKATDEEIKKYKEDLELFQASKKYNL